MEPDSDGCYIWQSVDAHNRALARWVREYLHTHPDARDSAILGGLRWPHLCAVCQLLTQDSSLEPLAFGLFIEAVAHRHPDAPASFTAVATALQARGESSEIAGRCPFRR